MRKRAAELREQAKAVQAEATANGDPLPDRTSWTSMLTGDPGYAQLAGMTR